MIAKLLSGAALASFLLAASTPVTFAADAPRTKEECEKAKGMKWDEATKTCVKAVRSSSSLFGGGGRTACRRFYVSLSS